MSGYEKQAADFLERFKLTLSAIPADAPECPPFCDGKHVHGDKYMIIIGRDFKRVQTTRHKLAFPFWNSLADKQAGEAISDYDVLACVGSDAYCPETFAEFCGEYGYDEDSRKAEKTFKAADAFARKLRAFFSEEELAALAEIR